MLLFYFFLLLIVVLTVFIVFKAYIHRNKHLPVLLFVEAMRDENNGQFEAALITYESALDEIKKFKYQNKLKMKILAKLKIMHTIIEYKKNQLFTRS